MRLENLYENFGNASSEMQAKYMSEYRLRRSEDLSKTPTWPKQKKASKAKKPKVKKGDSMKLSYEMFRGGKSFEDIAEERGIGVETIRSHMTNYIREGELDILELMDEDKLAAITKALKEKYHDSIVPLKKHLGKDVSFNEIRWVMALRSQKQ